MRVIRGRLSRVFCGLLLLLVAGAATAEKPAPLLAIIIDDLGDNRSKGLAAIALPGAITYAFLPHTPFSQELARAAHKGGKEVILHAPMESKSGRRLGPGALEHFHDNEEIELILSTGLDSIPHVAGMNNHMGSRLTEDREKVSEIMQVMRKRGLFFVDSVTTPDTVAWKVARQQGIPYLTRDVFLDNRQEQAYIHNQFKQGLKIAVEQGYAVLIGHPYPETVAYLEKVLPVMSELGVRLVTASELIRIRSTPKLMLVRQALEQCDQYEGHCTNESAPGQ